MNKTTTLVLCALLFLAACTATTTTEEIEYNEQAHRVLEEELPLVYPQSERMIPACFDVEQYYDYENKVCLEEQ